jgi:hypothetical protein
VRGGDGGETVVDEERDLGFRIVLAEAVHGGEGEDDVAERGVAEEEVACQGNRRPRGTVARVGSTAVAGRGGNATRPT